MIYYELSDLYEDKINDFDLKCILDGFKYIKFYAFINHCKTDGVKPHYHILIQVDLNNKKAKNKIEKDFNNKDLKPFVKNVRNAKAFARYLTHKDYADKEQYNDNFVITSNRDHYNELIKIDLKKNKIESILNEFYNWLINRCIDRTIINDCEIFEWFLAKGQSNYFICHRRSIKEIINDVYYFSDYKYKELERRNNLNVSNNNNSDSYTIDNLI